MADFVPRSKILANLKNQIKNNRPILAFGAGSGLTAKCAEIGGADLICIYSTAKYRIMGLPSILAWLPYSNANNLILNLSKEILSTVKTVPCIVGIGAHDPTLNIETFIKKLIKMGYSGITNEPFVGMYGKEFGDLLEQSGLGFSKEVELIKKAHDMDVFTIGWAFTPEEASVMAEAGADVIGAMVGVTKGGLTGADASIDLQQATIEIEKIAKAAESVKRDIIVLTHGGPLKDIKTAQYSVHNTSTHGYFSGSSGERIPTENAVVEFVAKFKETGISPSL